MRARRRQVTAEGRRIAAQAFARIANRSMLLRPGKRIAVYQAVGHEADMSAVIRLARERGCKVYLPRVIDRRRNRMQFVPFDASSPMRRNAFGILEPWGPIDAVRVRDLDIVFMPLVAFDSCGWRLGSGAGFYDRKLHHLGTDRRWRRPRLIGIAYDFQRVPHLHPHRWDIPFDAVITEKGMQRSHARIRNGARIGTGSHHTGEPT
jgi:5-formyltetrahydrofolate cyclo-ligase